MGTNTRMCRICFDAKLENLIAFQIDSDWAHLFEFCTGLSIIQSKSPQHFCKCCSEKLRDNSNFKNKCLKSDFLWQKIIKNAENETGQAKSEQETENKLNDDYDSYGDEFEYEDSFTDTIQHETKEETFKRPFDVIENSDFDNKIPSKDKVTDFKSNKLQKNKAKQHVAGSRKSTRTIKPPKKFTSNETHQARPKLYDLSTIYDAPTIHNDSFATRNTTTIPVKIINYLKKFDKSDLLQNCRPAVKKRPIPKLKPQNKTTKSHTVSTLKKIKIVSYLDTKAQKEPKKKSEALDDASSGDEKDEHKNNQDSDYDPEDDIAYQCRKPKVCHIGTEGTKVKVVKYNQQGSYGSVIVPNDTKYSCGICKFGPTDSEAIHQHWNMHVVKGHLNCRLCQFIGRDMADMLTHRFEHIPPDYKTIKICLVCFKKSTVTRRLEFHYRSEHLNKKGGICKYCSQELGCFKIWKSHEQSHVDPCICDHCGYHFRSKNLLQEHWLNLMSKHEYICEHCGHTFKRKRNMEVHVRDIHFDRNLKCSHCDKSFRNQNALKTHLRSLDGAKYFCETCGKSYTTARSLKCHILIHTNANTKPFSCEYCQRPFRWKHGLKSHIQRAHIKVRSIKCEVCSKAFFTKRDVRRHMSMHTGIRPVKCSFEQCDKTFYGNSVMMAHFDSKHRNEGSFDISLSDINDAPML